jgi:thiol-disulfide isomerase/thioredoxin
VLIRSATLGLIAALAMSPGFGRTEAVAGEPIVVLSAASKATATEAASFAEWTTPPPPLALDALSGGRRDLAGTEGGGAVVLVHFFATWCEPCREELAALDALAVGFAPGAISILAVDVGEVDVRVRRFFEGLPVRFPVLLDRDRAAAKAWGVRALPTTFVLDAAGRPRLIVAGDPGWDSAATRRTLSEVAGSQN